MKGWWGLVAALTLTVACSRVAESDIDPSSTVRWSKPEWITAAFEALSSGRYPRIRAVSYWHERFRNDDGGPVNLRIDSSPESLAAYRKGLTLPGLSFSAFFEGWKIIPDPLGVYISSFPSFGPTEDEVTVARISEFEKLADKPLVWAYFSDNWNDNIRFPLERVQIIHGAGRIPFIRMMPRSQQAPPPDPVYSLEGIGSGKFDVALKAWGEAARQVEYPLLVEFGTEVNGDWFPWNGKWNGEARGPELFRKAYRHIVDLFRSLGVKNITWFYHVDAGSSPVAPWNTMAAYYPGDDYVDWIGISLMAR